MSDLIKRLAQAAAKVDLRVQQDALQQIATEHPEEDLDAAVLAAATVMAPEYEHMVRAVLLALAEEARQ